MNNVISVRDTLEQALDAFEKIALRPWHSQVRAIAEQSIAALKEAIKQQGEPITIVTGSNDGCFDGMSDEITDLLQIGTKLYTSAPTKDAGTSSAVPDAHELWAAAQLVNGEVIEDGVARIEAMLSAAHKGK